MNSTTVERSEAEALMECKRLPRLIQIPTSGINLIYFTHTIFIVYDNTRLHRLKYGLLKTAKQTIIPLSEAVEKDTRSSAVAERPTDALCPSVVSFNSTIPRVQSFVYLRQRRRSGTAVYITLGGPPLTVVLPATSRLVDYSRLEK